MPRIYLPEPTAQGVYPYGGHPYGGHPYGGHPYGMSGPAVMVPVREYRKRRSQIKAA